MNPRRIFGLGTIVVLLLFGSFWETASAHPRRRNRKPSKATAGLKQVRKTMDAVKKQLLLDGKYACCIKPACDMCAKTNGSCKCAVNVASGKGACGECLEGWQAGRGIMDGVKAEKVALLPSPEQKIESDVPPPAELASARENMNALKRTLVAEGRYACCIGGGCDTCAHEGECACGTNLAEITTAKASKTPSKKDLKDEGVCGECLDGWHAGKGLYQGVELAEIKLAPMGDMPSGFGVGTMFRQGSGTSWIPESSAMYARMKEIGPWMLMYHPYAFTTYAKHSGPRGDDKFYSANWFMASAQREVAGLTKYGNGTLLFRAMMSLDPLTVGRSGYPLLFQTGESNRGRPLVDRQHPHDLFMELAVAYSAPISEKLVMSVYAAPVGEPALGPSAFPHRLSAMDNPEAPLGHHWQDSTHIAAGVLTLGLGTEKWKAEGSLFTGAEPDENRWNIDRPKFDSWAARFSVSPHKDLSMQVSYGHLREPEALEPGVNIHRITASVGYNKLLKDNSHWATSFIWGRNEKRGSEANYGTNAFLVESTYSFKDRQSLFMRFENIDKDELFVGDDHHGRGEGKPEIFKINRLTLGGVYNLPIPGKLEVGVGASVGLHTLPFELKSTYGDSPVSGNVFFRIRFKRWNRAGAQ